MLCFLSSDDTQRKHLVLFTLIRFQTQIPGITTSTSKANGFHKLARCPWNPTGDIRVPNTDQSTVYRGTYKGIDECGRRKASAFQAD